MHTVCVTTGTLKDTCMPIRRVDSTLKADIRSGGSLVCCSTHLAGQLAACVVLLGKPSRRASPVFVGTPPTYRPWDEAQRRTQLYTRRPCHCQYINLYKSQKRLICRLNRRFSSVVEHLFRKLKVLSSILRAGTFC